ncbi:unnamed protein product, partial [Rotaria sordida]
QPPLPPPPLSTSTQQQMQEFYQQALQMRKQAFNYWLTQIHNLEKSLSIYLNKA